MLLITIDTLRADRVAGADDSGSLAPRLDAFARRGTRFEWAFSTCSYTIPSHASMFVGMYPSFHSAGLANGQQALSPDETTLAEILGDAGWATAAITSNAVLRGSTGLSQGFDSYDDELPDRELVRDLRERRASNAVDRAIEKLRELDGAPFFLWLHLQDPHGPYTPPIANSKRVSARAGEPGDASLPIGRDNSGFRAIPAYQVFGDERAIRDYETRYDGEVRYLDAELGRVFDELDARPVSDEMLVVVTADHGESMGEDEFYFAHGHSVGLDQVKVPLIFVGSGVLPDRSVATPVSNMSVFSTILDYLDQPTPVGRQSRSLLATLTSDADAGSEPFFTESYTQRGIVFAGQYLRMDRRPANPGLFWRKSPISEGFIKPLGTQTMRLTPGGGEVETPTDLLEKLQRFTSNAEASRRTLARSTQRRALSPAQIEELRALGYAP